MKNLKYVLFSFLLCFMFLKSASANASCVYDWEYANITVTCNVTNSSVTCTSNNTVSVIPSGVSLKSSDFIKNNVFVCPSKIFAVANTNTLKITNIAPTRIDNSYDPLVLNKKASIDGSSVTGSEGEPSTPPANDDQETIDGEFTPTSFCQDKKIRGTFRIIGYVIFVIKILIPIMLIIFGSIDFGKAIIASKDDEIKNAMKTLVMRTIAGIIIFFIPTIISFIINLVDNSNGQTVQSHFNSCTHCMLDPFDDSCGSLLEVIK